MTSEGSDRANEPTRDMHLDEPEKGCDDEDMVGIRKSGNETVGLRIAFERYARLLVAVMLVLWYLEHLLNGLKSVPSPAKSHALAILGATPRNSLSSSVFHA